MEVNARHATESGPAFQHTGSGRPRIEKIIVAIHGIGSQVRSETVRSVATRFGARGNDKPALMPLGFFHVEGAGNVRVSRLDVPPGDAREKIGFAEVFWADIPRAVVEKKDTLEETKAWGKTVVSRAQAEYEKKVKKSRGQATGKGELSGADFALVAGAVDEIVETVDVLENLTRVAAKAGLFKFDLGPLLRDYLGDVQVVTEFGYYRQQIVHRFHSLMEEILSKYCEEFGTPPAALHIVAHSEGTVVSFLAMLQALSGAVQDPDKPISDEAEASKSPEWIKYVRGYMTIGSPIDKHLVLWPDIWNAVRVGGNPRQINVRSTIEQSSGDIVFHSDSGVERLRLKEPIRWRNYYDYGDPIGFRLETAEDWLGKQNCAAFEFETKDHDFGFSRYILPGKAHNDYWNDDVVFGHFIDDVVSPVAKAEEEQNPHGGQKKKGPPDKPGVAAISSGIPYLLSWLCHFGAIFWLFKAVTTYIDSDKIRNRDAAAVIVGLTLLLAGVTVAARLPRLVKPHWGTYLSAAAAFAAGAAAYWLVPENVRAWLGTAFPEMPLDFLRHVGVIVLAAIPVLLSWFWSRKPRRGRRLLVGSGAAVVALLVTFGVGGEGAQDAPIWPVFVAGAGFLYLWWLGMLVFDLAFMWHRYIRHSVAAENLWFWKEELDTPSSSKACEDKKQEVKARIKASARAVTGTAVTA